VLLLCRYQNVNDFGVYIFVTLGSSNIVDSALLLCLLEVLKSKLIGIFSSNFAPNVDRVSPVQN